MSNAKSMGATFMVNLVMFIVLIVITFGPPAIIMKDYFDAVMEGNISKASSYRRCRNASYRFNCTTWRICFCLFYG